MLLSPTLVAWAAAPQDQSAALVPAATSAQDRQAQESVVPRFINFNGTIKDRTRLAFFTAVQCLRATSRGASGEFRKNHRTYQDFGQ
jgi:hypothetical protein